MKQMKPIKLIKTFALVLPKKSDNPIFCQYILNDRAENEIELYCNNINGFIRADFNCGLSEYSCYLEFEYNVVDSEIEKHLNYLSKFLCKKKYTF